MPTAQLFTAAVEKAVNGLLSLDASAEKHLAGLAGKSLKLTLTELPWPLVFHFSDRVDVVIGQNETKAAGEDASCTLAMSLSTIQTLQDSSQITRLIKQNKLHLEGDINVAQQFGHLVTQLDIDWEEQLSHYTGDVVAHQIFYGAKQLADKANRTVNKLAFMLAEGAIEEKRIAAPGILVVDYCDQVNTLRSDVARLEARLVNLEKHTQSKVLKGETK